MKPKILTNICGALVLTAVFAGSAQANDLALGTWISKAHPGMTMVIEPIGSDGRRITYHVLVNGNDSAMTLDSAMDGTDAPMLVNGKPTGQTMAIKRLDNWHSATTIKSNGKITATSKAELSKDGGTITSENVDSATQAKTTDVWTKK